MHDSSRNVEFHPYALSVYIRKALADDMEAVFAPLQVYENQYP